MRCSHAEALPYVGSDAAASRLAAHMKMPEKVTRGDGFKQSLAIALQQLGRLALLHTAAAAREQEAVVDGLLIAPPVAFHAQFIPQVRSLC